MNPDLLEVGAVAQDVRRGLVDDKALPVVRGRRHLNVRPLQRPRP